jgi:hypothetical protein
LVYSNSSYMSLHWVTFSWFQANPSLSSSCSTIVIVTVSYHNKNPIKCIGLVQIGR